MHHPFWKLAGSAGVTGCSVSQGRQHCIPQPATENGLPHSCTLASLPEVQAPESLTGDVAAHVFDVHLMEPDLSGGVSDGDRAVLVVHNLRCGRLPRRHVDLSSDFSFSDRKRNDQVERFKPQAVHVTHWDIGLFGDLKTGSSGHWVKWTTA